MNERLKDILHRWLPKLTILSVLVLLSSFLFLEFYVVPRKKAAIEDRNEQRDRIRKDEQAMAGEAKAALERIVGLIDTLDGNSQTQEALSKAVAQEEAIGEVWVTNAQGIIVYYGRYRPPVSNVADIPLGTLTELLDSVPEELLSPIQRTAILLPATIGGYWGVLRHSIFFPTDDIVPKHLIISSTEPYRYTTTTSRTHVEMTRVKDGLIAVVASRPSYIQSMDRPMERLKRIRLVRNITVAVVMIGSLSLFWLSIPAWMALDAQKRHERAAIWGLFGLLGNMIALVVYMLVRENEDPSGNSK